MTQILEIFYLMENIIVKALIFTIKDVNIKWDAMPDSDVSIKLGQTKKLFSDLTHKLKTKPFKLFNLNCVSFA